MLSAGTTSEPKLSYLLYCTTVLTVLRYEFSTDVVIVGDKDGKFTGFHGKKYGDKSAGKVFREFLTALNVLPNNQYKLTAQTYRVLCREKAAGEAVHTSTFEQAHKIPEYMSFLQSELEALAGGEAADEESAEAIAQKEREREEEERKEREAGGDTEAVAVTAKLSRR